MGFRDFAEQEQGIGLLQRSLERRRVAHAYLFTGQELEHLEDLARTLAKTLNCVNPIKKNGVAIDSCDKCLSCQKIIHGNHADVHWIRPESKSRVITVAQMREVMHEINLKPTEAEYKVAVIVAADRLNVQAANAFLKTLEEPPAKSILVLLTSDPQRLLETILSRCLRLNFGGAGPHRLEPAQMEWLGDFSQMAARPEKSLLVRYRLLDVLLKKLGETKSRIEEALTARSPLQQYKDAEKELIDRWESELSASIEAEYRRQRADLLGIVQWWLRDIWLSTLEMNRRGTGHEELLTFPTVTGICEVAQRISPRQALENLETIESLQRWLGTNVQEALALEVSLLKLQL